jgi:hypothetical protein
LLGGKFPKTRYEVRNAIIGFYRLFELYFSR